MVFMFKVGESIIQCIFVGWIVFFEIIFICINFKFEVGFLLKKMLDIFVKIGYGFMDMIIDCIEFKFQYVLNFDLNFFMFFNYKNIIIGKVFIGIVLYGMGFFFSDIYLGFILDNCIIEKLGVVQWI